jgi:hypothetical protein
MPDKMMVCCRSGCNNRFPAKKAVVGYKFPIGELYFCSKKCLEIVRRAD